MSPEEEYELMLEYKRQNQKYELEKARLEWELSRRYKQKRSYLPRKYMTDKHKKQCVDDGEQAIRVVSGGMSDADYQKLGGTGCPFCRAEESCYHDNFYKEDIPVQDGLELHASVCDTCQGTWYDVVEADTGMLIGTRHVDFEGKPLPKPTPAAA